MGVDSMDENQKKYFRTVCETKSISKAAEKLYISRQSLSASISRMERELGTSLFERQNNGITATENGKKLLACLAEQDLIWQAFLKEIQEKDTAEHETIRIAVGGVTLDPAEIEYYLSYERANPNVTVELVNGDLPNNIRLLKEGKIDIISSIYTSESPDYLRIELEEGRDVNNVSLLISKNSPLAELSKIDLLNDLHGVTLLHEGSYLPEDFRQICRNLGIKTKSVLLSRESICFLIGLGKACLYMPDKYCSRFVDDTITSRPLQHLPLDLHNCFLYRRNISGSARKMIHYLYRLYNQKDIVLPDE